MFRLLMVLIIASFTAAAPNDFKITVQKRAVTYISVDTPVTWQQGEAACEAMNGKLAEIRTPAEQDAMTAVLDPDEGYWIGVNDFNVHTVFEYATGGQVTYGNWYAGQPNNDLDNDCVWMLGMDDYKWVNTLCNTTPYAVCEVPQVGVSGDPHMTTFDGLPYSYQGICWHTLFKHCSPNPDFEVTAEFESREDSTMDQVRTRTVSVNVTVGGEFAIINGMDVVTGRTDGSMLKSRSIHVQENDKTITLSFTSKNTTFTLSWTLKKHSLSVSVSGSDYQGHLCGLLGNGDGNTHNDFQTPDGVVVHDATEFGESWKVGGNKCD